MILKEIAHIYAGYLNRGRIETRENGSHRLIQARDVDADHFAFSIRNLVLFNPALSRRDCVLIKGDILFMARGVRNYSILLRDVPQDTLAAACFFIVRACRDQVLPAYLAWYFSQKPVQQYLAQHSGRSVHMPVVKRAVLEHIPVPVPALEEQKKIAGLFALLLEERALLHDLFAKQKQLVEAVCLRAAHGEQKGSMIHDGSTTA